MKRRDLIKKLEDTAKGKGRKLELVREGGNHSIYRIGTHQFSIPRHNEINEITVKDILNTAKKVEG